MYINFENDLENLVKELNNAKDYRIINFANTLATDDLRDYCDNETELKEQVFIHFVCEYSIEVLKKLFFEKNSNKILEETRQEIVKLFCIKYGVNIENCNENNLDSVVGDIYEFLDDGYRITYLSFIDNYVTDDTRKIFEVYFKTLPYLDFSELIQIIYRDKAFIYDFRRSGYFSTFCKDIDNYLTLISKALHCR
jgi:hypothetical protein